jgi:2-succinyl-5-enolpyruvyl-6-hydroxy-3-cyclohexene-1-carboxylate synthase
MYSDKQNALQLISLLKQNDIKTVVISPGSRHIPFAHSVENDSFFNCYAIIDERSAGYFALGLIQKIGKPVVICCTSGTAALNYTPAVAEAYYQRLPLIIITGDKPFRSLHQLPGQMVPQVTPFKDIVKKSVDIFEAKEIDDIIYINRMINEAFIELHWDGDGPVHINLQASSPLDNFSTKDIPIARKIFKKKIDLLKSNEIDEIIKTMNNKKILFLYGQNKPISSDEESILSIFFEKLCCVVVADNISNIHGKHIFTCSNLLYSKISLSERKYFSPDIVITYGGELVSKEINKLFSNKTTHWHIDEKNDIIDQFNILNTQYIGCLKKFALMINNKMVEANKNIEYFERWNLLRNGIIFENRSWSDLLVLEKVNKYLPESSSLHIANSNSIRNMQFVEVKASVKVFCNRGTSGIDGCMSTAAGYAAANEGITLLIIGDLSFFYDSNAFWNNHHSKNFKVLLINNNTGELLRLFYGKKSIPSFSPLFGISKINAEHYAKLHGIEYLSAKNLEEFDETLTKFFTVSKVPVILEVFVSGYETEKALSEIYNDNSPNDLRIARKIKKMFT